MQVCKFSIQIFQNYWDDYIYSGIPPKRTPLVQKKLSALTGCPLYRDFAENLVSDGILFGVYETSVFGHIQVIF